MSFRIWTPLLPQPWPLLPQPSVPLPLQPSVLPPPQLLSVPLLQPQPPRLPFLLLPLPQRLCGLQPLPPQIPLQPDLPLSSLPPLIQPGPWPQLLPLQLQRILPVSASELPQLLQPVSALLPFSRQELLLPLLCVQPLFSRLPLPQPSL